MSDHLPECESYRDECGGGCICEHVRACEQRMLMSAIAAVREAIGEKYDGRIVPKGEYDCCGCSSYDGIVDDATNAIESLRGKP